MGNVLSRTATEAAVSGQSGTGGSETQNFCYDEQNRLIWASNNATVPSAGNGTCGSATYQSTLGGNYTNQYAYTNLGQLWQGPMNGGSTQEQYLYCDSAHPTNSATCPKRPPHRRVPARGQWITREAMIVGATRPVSYEEGSPEP